MLTKPLLLDWMLEDGSGILYDKKNPGIFTGYVTFTPERIALALKNNTHNRRIKDDQILSLTDVLTHGNWDENVSKINFDENMVLSDGQHRLIAALKREDTIRVLVTAGMKPTAQAVTDRRGNRTLGNDFEIAGIPNARKVATLTRICCAFENGETVKHLIERDGRTLASFSDITLQRYYYSHQEKVQRLKRICQSTYRAVQELKINGSILNVLVYQFDSISAEDAEAFWDSLGSGVYENKEDPIRQLRLRLTANVTQGTQKIPRRVVAALIIKAWNLYEKGETVKQLKFTAGGATPEPFPEIYNPYKEE